MRNTLILVKNTLKITFRKKGNFAIYLLLPIFAVLLSILIYSNVEQQSVSIGIVDNDASRLSKDFAVELAGSGGYKTVEVAEEEAIGLLVGQKLEAVIIVPKGYEEGIYTNAPINMELVFLKGTGTAAWLEQYIDLHTQNLVALSVSADGNREAFDEMYKLYKDNTPKVGEVRLQDRMTEKSVTKTSMGFILMLLMFGASLTSHFMLNEKRDRTYYRICSSPVSSREYIAGNMLSSLAVITVQVIVVILFIKYVFRLETFVPVPLLFLTLILFGMVSIGFGLVITAYSGSSYMAGVLSSLIITPMCMLGGCFWPVSLMPEVMQKLAKLMPQWWALDALASIQSGAPVWSVSVNYAILAAFAAALILIAIYRLATEDDVRKFI